MRPPTNALYCETTVSTCWPSHSMTRVSGRTVTSVRNGWSSTVPTSRFEDWSAMGNSGFVISVGFENVGTARSTRSAGSATSMSVTLGCGICATPLAAGEDEAPAAADADGEELGEGFEQPATTNTARMA